MENYRAFLGDYYSTGEGGVISIMIVTNNNEQEWIDQWMSECFGLYYCSSVEEVDLDTLMQYQNYIPEYVQKIIQGKVMQPGAFRWHSQVFVNYA